MSDFLATLTELAHGMALLPFLTTKDASALLTVSKSCSNDIVRHHNKKPGFSDPEWAEGVRGGRPYTKFLWNRTWVMLPCHVRHMKIKKTHSFTFERERVYTLALYSEPYPRFTREEVEEWAEDRKCPYQEWLETHVRWTGTCDRNEWKRFKLAYKADAAARDCRYTREARQREEAARRAAEEEKARIHAKAHPFIPLKKPSTPAPWAKKLPAGGAGAKE